MSAEGRRNSIVDAAVRVIAAEGLTRATTRRIAEEANAPLGTLHYCFRNKDELQLLVLERGRATARAAFAEIDPDLGLEPTIRSLVGAYWRWVRDNLGLHLALMELLLWLIRNKDEVGRAQNRDVYSLANAPFGGQLIRESLAAAAKADREPMISVDDIARFMIHRFDGFVFEYAESGDEATCERQTGLLADALVALAVPPGAGIASSGG